ncbi:MAG TPA: DUF2630 family protein [Candidatus Kapabacteria bacterium]|nr:DUF2630 family protein [Candidatus Kapabacteria bacterium]
MNDKSVLGHIEDLMAEERRLLAATGLDADEQNRLNEIGVELDQYWDLLRQRRALRDAGENPDQAELRPPGIVENYEQ